MKTCVLVLVIALFGLGLWNQESTHVQWVASALTEMETVKVGMKREELLRVFTTEGGISSPSQRRYVYRNCPLFKVDVQFQTQKDASGRAVESPNDVITTISKPFIERPIVD